MGIFDFLNRFRQKQSTGKSADQAIASVKAAAQASNYNQASVQAFYALEEIGKAYALVEREISTTAREYSKLLVEDGRVSEDDMAPIIQNFEVAKYSPDEVTFDDYRNVESSLETVVQKFKKPAARASKGGAKRSKKSRRKKRKRKATGKRRNS